VIDTPKTRTATFTSMFEQCYLGKGNTVVVSTPELNIERVITAINKSMIFIDECPPCQPAVITNQDDHRSKDNFRPASDWNYLQLRKKKW